MILGEIYKRDFQGRLRVWYAEVSPDGTQYRTVSGLYDGARTTSEWTQCRANAQRATAQAQCEFEVDALYRHRLARTYHQTIEATEGGAHFFEPMLAHPLDRKRMGEPHIYIQPKLDGARCIATADGLFTRQGKEFLSAPHISRALKPYFELHPDAILDGELYGDKMAVDFQRIMSLARKTKNITDADLRESERLLQLHLYDMPSRGHDTYAARYAGICEAARIVSAHAPEWGDSPIRVVETFAITTSGTEAMPITAAASHSRLAQSSPGTACHTARAARPSPSASRNCSPRPYCCQVPVSTSRGVRGGSSGGGCFSTVACRGGMASRSTSGRLPAYRAATASASRCTSGVSTRSAETTRSSQPSLPEWSVSERLSRMKASTSRPLNRTLARTPGCASSDRSAGTR